MVFLLFTGDPVPLVTVLKKIMWRTCKSTVWDMLGIPPQSDVIHYVVMSDLETFFYNSQHEQCAVMFREKARKLSNTVCMRKFNASTLKQVSK